MHAPTTTQSIEDDFAYGTNVKQATTGVRLGKITFEKLRRILDFVKNANQWCCGLQSFSSDGPNT